VYAPAELDALPEPDLLNYDPNKVAPALQIQWEQYDLEA